MYQQLHHRNIVTTLEAFTTDDGLHIILEQMPISSTSATDPRRRSPAAWDQGANQFIFLSF